MKKLSLVLAAFMAVTTLQAQDEKPRHEIGVSYGTGVSLIGDGVVSALGAGLFDGLAGRKWTNNKEFGTLGLEYFYHLPNTPRAAVGGIVTYARYGEDVEKDDEKVGVRRRTFMSVLPSFKYYYVDSKHFGLYSKLAAGAMFVHAKSEDLKNNKTETDNDIIFMWQASLLGLEGGSQNVRCFIELGFGEQGIALIGLKYKF